MRGWNLAMAVSYVCLVESLQLQRPVPEGLCHAASLTCSAAASLFRFSFSMPETAHQTRSDLSTL